jgi:hypothetical protein
MWTSTQQKEDLKEGMADRRQKYPWRRLYKINSPSKHTHKYLVSYFSSGTTYPLTEIRFLSFFTYFTETDFTTKLKSIQNT